MNADVLPEQVATDMVSTASPMVTEAARYVLGISIAACFAALAVAMALWVFGRRSDNTQATSRSLLGMLVALVALVLLLFLALIYAL